MFKKVFIAAIAIAMMVVGVQADTATVNGITWTYTVSDGEASIGNGWESAIPETTIGAITIPSTLGGYPVTSIGEDAFEDCDGLTSVTIPDSVTSIGDSAFSGCSGLTSITIPDSVTFIGDYAFRSCSGLTSVTIPDSVTSIGDSAFRDCSGLTSVTIGNSVTSIGEWAFCWCSGLTSVTIPDSVTSIGYNAFYNCSGLTNVTIGNSVTSIGDSAFYSCSGLTSVTIPDSVTNIGHDAFSHCSGLMNAIFLGDAPKSVGDSIFYRCHNYFAIKVRRDTKGWDGDYTSTAIPANWHGYQIEYLEDNCEDMAITNIVAKQRYPWNGLVDIKFTITGTNICYTSFVAVDIAGGTNIPMKTITKSDGALAAEKEVLEEGTYNWVWNAAKDLPEGFESDQVTVAGIVEESKHDKVQLWEGGPYWATMNIGAEKPEDCGYYFWWGDTVGFKRENDKWVASDGSNTNFSFTKSNTPTYNKNQSTLLSEGWVVEKGGVNVLAPKYDAAQVQWGGEWRMPTYLELTALVNECVWTWATRNGVNGYVVRGSGSYASNSIFLPSSGYGYQSFLKHSSDGNYWSSSGGSEDNVSGAYDLGFDSSDYHTFTMSFRYYGLPIRPVQGFYADTVEATSPIFTLSLPEDGILKSKGVETLTFSSLWDGDESATVTIEQNGVAIAENLTGEGDSDWSVAENGTYVLTHTTYTNGVAGKVETATFVVSGFSVEFPEESVSVAGYTGKYDGASHSIAVSVSDEIDGAVIKYSTSENGEFTATAPVLTDVGTITVWCEIAATGYITKTNSATITIVKRSVVLTSASGTKVYDGTALKAESVTVGGDGFADGEGVTYTFTGSQTDVGTSENTFSYALNANTKAGNYEITTANGTLAVTAADISADAVIALGANPKYSGAEQEIAVESVTYKGLPATYTVSGNKATDAGSYTVTIAGTGNFTGTKTAEWSIAKREVVLTSASDSKVYDGTALKAESVTVGGDGFVNGEGATYTFTGSQTVVGISENSFTYALNANTKASNYVITTANGTLEVTAIGATDESKWAITLEGDNAKYDGTEKTVTIAALSYDGTVIPNYTVSGDKATDAGSYTLTITAAGNFTGTKTAEWSISKRAVTLTSASSTKVYDGTALKAESVTVGGDGFADGEGVTYTFTGSQTDVGASENTFAYALNANTKASNYEITTADGKLEVTAADISADAVIAVGTNPKYSGAEQEIAVASVTYKGLPVTYTVAGNKATDAGSYTVTIAGTGNFTGSKTAEWSIGKRAVTLTSASDSKVYDGTALKAESVTVGGDGFADGEGATYTFTGSQTAVGTSENGFTYALNANTKAGNYEITTANGTLEVTAIGATDESKWAITLEGDNAKYDGTEKTVTIVALSYDGTVIPNYTVSGDKATDAGSYTLTITAAGNFTGSKTAQWSIGKRAVKLTSASDSKVYDGTALKAESVAVGGDGFADGEGTTYTFTGSQTEVGVSENRFSYALNANTKASNYEITTANGALTVTKAKYPGQEAGGTGIAWNVATDAATWMYDGAEHGVALTGVPSGVTAKLTGNSAVDAGTYTASVVLEYDELNYEAPVAPKPIEWSITRRPITLMAASKDKPYDGFPLEVKGSDITASGSGYAPGECFEYYNMASITEVGEIAATFSYRDSSTAKVSNYDVTVAGGQTLKVTVGGDQISVTADSAIWAYDGTEHSLKSWTVINGDKLLSGHELQAKISDDSVITTPSDGDNGIVSNSFEYVKIVDRATGADRTRNYNLFVYEGSLQVTNATIHAEQLSGITDISKTYDGISSKVAVGAELLQPATIKYSLGDSGVWSDSAPEFVNVGNYTVGFTVDADYYHSYTGTLNVAIARRPLKFTSPTKAKPYDGTALTFNGSEIEVDGVVNGEGFIFSNFASITDSGRIDSTFDYEAKGGTLASNYDIAINNGSLTIRASADEIAVTANDATWVYDGTEHSSHTYTVENGNKLQPGDELVVTFSDESVITTPEDGHLGNGIVSNIITSVKVVRNGTTDVSSNYTLVWYPGMLSVTKAKMVVDGSNFSREFTYDGEGHTITVAPPTLLTSPVTVSYGISSDAITSDAAPLFRDAGTYTVYYSISAKYYESYTGSAVVTIKPRPVTLISSAAEKVYDGSPLKKDEVLVKDGSLGFVNGEGYTATCTGALTDVGGMENLFDYTFINGTKSDNYIITKEYGWLRITPATLDASVVFGGDILTCKRVFNGMAQKVQLSPVFSEAYKLTWALVSGDESAYGDAAPTLTNVSQGELDVFFKFVSPNYKPYYGKVVFSITPKTLTADNIVLVTEASDCLYDGTEKKPTFTLTDGSPSIITADDIAVAYNNNVDAGVAIAKFTGKGNYTGIVSKEWSIAKRAVTLTSASDSKVYDGTALKAESVTVGGDGFVNGEGATYTFTGSQTDVGTSENTFAYRLNANTKAGNYDITTANGKLTVTASGATDESKWSIRLEGDNAKYDGTEKTVTVSALSYDGVVIPNYTVTGNKATDAGSYTLTITATGNFTGTKTADWSIAKRVVTLTSASDSKVYDGTALKAESVTVSGDGFANGEGATYTFTGSQTDVGTSENGFSYTLNGNTKAGNYDVTTANGTLTVTAPPTVELKIDLSKTEKGKGAWGNVKLFTNSIPLKAAVAGSITTYTINGGANVDLAFVPNEGFRIYGTQAGNGPFTSTTNYTFVAMTNSTYSATFQPAPKTGFAWKYAKNKNGWFCAQIAFPGFEGYAEAFENPRFLFADRVNSQNVRTSYLVDPSTVIDPLGTTEVYGNTTYRKVALPVSAFAGKVNGARVVFGVSDATMASSVDSVPAAERIMALRVVNRNINSVELLDNVIGYFAWDCCGETFYQPLGGKQSPGVILTKLLSIRTLNNAAAFGIDASAVAPEYVNCRFTSFNIANGKFVGTFEVVAESDEGTKAAVQEITSSVSTLLLGSESPAGPFEAIGDEVKDLTFDVDNAPFTFQGTLPQKYKFFRLNLNIEEIYK